MIVDLWADVNKPVAKPIGTTYKVTVSGTHIRTKMVPFVYLEVDQYGIIGIDHYRTVWFGHSVNDESTRREIIEWLVEWDFAVWRPIGEEQNELFATEKLTGGEHESL